MQESNKYPELVGIVAMTPDRVIGKNGQLPWHIANDLKLFRRLTYGCPVIMGRKTFESIGRPLPGRLNIVLTSQKDLEIEGVYVVRKPEDFQNIRIPRTERVFVIGGSEVYSMFKPFMDKLLVSRIFKRYSGDTKFPSFRSKFTKKRVIEKYPEFELQEYVPRTAQLELFELDQNSGSFFIREHWEGDPRRFLESTGELEIDQK